jgi:hypothetical protein
LAICRPALGTALANIVHSWKRNAWITRGCASIGDASRPKSTSWTPSSAWKSASSNKCRKTWLPGLEAINPSRQRLQSTAIPRASRPSSPGRTAIPRRASHLPKASLAARSDRALSLPHHCRALCLRDSPLTTSPPAQRQARAGTVTRTRRKRLFGRIPRVTGQQMRK